MLITMDERLHNIGFQNPLEIKLNPLKFFSKGLKCNSFYSVNVPHWIFSFQAT